MLTGDVTRFVAINRSLGLAFDEQQRTLRLYAAFAEERGDRYTSISRPREWCANASTPVRARTCYDTVRRLCIYLHAEDPRHEVPPAGAFGHGRRPRPAPHILEPHQLQAIMDAALHLEPAGSIRPYTYHYLFGLLAATGLRISEALALTLDDGLVVRHAKFGKSRLVPLHPTTRTALDQYQEHRRQLGGDGDDLFAVGTGRAPHKVTVHVVFVRLARELGLRGPGRTPGPRLHDLRHTFAVRSLEACPPDREAVARHIAALSTYLGHGCISNTYWYLEATPVLLHDIAKASEDLFLGEVA